MAQQPVQTVLGIQMQISSFDTYLDAKINAGSQLQDLQALCDGLVNSVTLQIQSMPLNASIAASIMQTLTASKLFPEHKQRLMDAIDAQLMKTV